MNTDSLFGVVAHLEEQGWQLQKDPTLIGGIPFRFSAVLTGPANTLDLALIEHIQAESQDRLLQKVQGVVLALDAVESRRSLTLIVFGADLDPHIATALSRLARVIDLQGMLKDHSDGDQDIRDALSILRAIDAPTSVTAAVADPIQRLLKALDPQKQSDLEKAGLFSASAFGADAVSQVFSSWVQAALEPEGII